MYEVKTSNMQHNYPSHIYNGINVLHDFYEDILPPHIMFCYENIIKTFTTETEVSDFLRQVRRRHMK